MIGFSVWWCSAPEPLLVKPGALCSPDLELLFKVVKDTFVNHVCSSHPQVTSPCDCGEPLNSAARDLFEEPPFDPLGINNTHRIKALSFFMASIILSIALAESVSQNGVYINFS